MLSNTKTLSFTICAIGIFAITTMLFCSADLNNPVDPESSNYVGRLSATDYTAPVITCAQSYDSLQTYQDTIVLAGTIRDTNGVPVMTINGQPVVLTYPNWTASLALNSGANRITVMAQDGSIHANQFTTTLTITRLSTPKAPSNVAISMVGRAVKISWQDNSGSETAFRIERSTNNVAYTPIDSVGANIITYTDSTDSFTALTPYYYRVIAINQAGESDVTGSNFIVYPAVISSDNTGPIISFFRPTDGTVVNTTTMVVYISCFDSSGVKSVSANGLPATFDGTNWKTTVPLIAGSNTISAIAIDNSASMNMSNASILVTYSATAVDITPPEISFISPLDMGTLSSENVTILLSAIDASGSVLWVKLNDTVMQPVAGSYSKKVTLTAGTNMFVVKASDNSNNIAIDTIHLNYSALAPDLTAPAISISKPQNLSRFSDTFVTVSGIATDANSISSVTVNDSAAEVTYPGFSATATLKHGRNTIRVLATDASTQHNTTIDSSVIVICNQRPGFVTTKTDTIITLGSAYSTVLLASDGDNDLLSYQFLNAPKLSSPTLTGNNTSVVISGYSPSVAGIDTFTVIVKDLWDGLDTLEWKVVVSIPPSSNKPPYFTTDTATLLRSAVVSDTYTVMLSAVDQNSDPLTYHTLQVPTGCTISSSGRISWVPTTADTGISTFRVTVSDGIQQDTLIWHVITIVAPIQIIRQPLSRLFYVSDKCTLAVTTTGSNPVSFQWLRNDTAIVGATSGTFIKADIQLPDAGSYVCKVTNAAGSVVSSIAQVTVTPPLTFTVQPKTSQSIRAGQNCSLSVATSGITALTYRWSKNGAPLSAAGSDLATLILRNVSISDSGRYTCLASDGRGQTTSNPGAVQIIVPVSITQQPPAYQSIAAGQSCTFSVVATGTSLTYQWKKGGQPISVATDSTYSIANVQVANSGTYTVTVTNAAGSVTSNNAIVEVQ